MFINKRFFVDQFSVVLIFELLILIWPAKTDSSYKGWNCSVFVWKFITAFSQVMGSPSWKWWAVAMKAAYYNKFSNLDLSEALHALTFKDIASLPK